MSRAVIAPPLLMWLAHFSGLCSLSQCVLDPFLLFNYLLSEAVILLLEVGQLGPLRLGLSLNLLQLLL